MQIICYNDKLIKKSNSIFLAGPTLKNSQSWRLEAIKILERLNFDGIVYVPEFKNPNDKKICFDEYSWDKLGIMMSSVVVLWMPDFSLDMLKFVSLHEMKNWFNTGKVVYGRPENSKKTRYLDMIYELNYHETPSKTLEELLIKGIKSLDDAKLNNKFTIKM